MKYDLLTDFLKKTPRHLDTVTLSFAQIEAIIHDDLPPACEEHRAWWANQKDVKNRPQAKAWTKAGFVADKVKIKKKWVRFARKS